MKYLVLLLVLLSSAVARADDCHPVANALAKQSATPVRVYLAQKTWDEHGQCAVRVSMFRQNVGEASYSPADVRDLKSIPANATCTLAGRSSLNGEAVNHYFSTERQSTGNLITEFWISPTTGLILKKYEVLPDKEITWKYDFKDADLAF